MRKLFKSHIVFLFLFFSAVSCADDGITSSSSNKSGIYGDKSTDKKCEIGVPKENPISEELELGCLIRKTTVFNLQNNVRIGFKYTIEGKLRGDIALEVRVKNTSFRKPDGTPLIEYVLPIIKKAEGGRIKGVVGFSFNKKSDMVPGVWSLAIYFNGSLITATTFEANEI